MIAASTQSACTAAPAPTFIFDGQRAVRDVVHQLQMGPRTPGSAAHAQILRWIASELTAVGWAATLQETKINGHNVTNLIAFRDQVNPYTLLGAHYDSRLAADQDPDPTKRAIPVPGGNDGASGVAVLLGIARSLPSSSTGVRLAFLDAEDNGNLAGWDWCLGSQALVGELSPLPARVVIVDMVGAPGLVLKREPQSNAVIVRQIWGLAKQFGYAQFQQVESWPPLTDDHVPFLRAGVPSVDIVGIGDPKWHTVADNTTNVSETSLIAVGTVVGEWLLQYTIASSP